MPLERTVQPALQNHLLHLGCWGFERPVMEIATSPRDHIPRGGVVRFRAEASAPPKRSSGFGRRTQSSSIQNHFFKGGFNKPRTIVYVRYCTINTGTLPSTRTSDV
jgi:hypothetical protein